MVSYMIPLAVLATLLGLGAAEVTLPSYYFDGMVFQGCNSTDIKDSGKQNGVQIGDKFGAKFWYNLSKIRQA